MTLGARGGTGAYGLSPHVSLTRYRGGSEYLDHINGVGRATTGRSSLPLTSSRAALLLFAGAETPLAAIEVAGPQRCRRRSAHHSLRRVGQTLHLAADRRAYPRQCCRGPWRRPWATSGENGPSTGPIGIRKGRCYLVGRESCALSAYSTECSGYLLSARSFKHPRRGGGSCKARHSATLEEDHRRLRTESGDPCPVVV